MENNSETARGQIEEMVMIQEPTETNDVDGHHLPDHEAVIVTGIVKDIGHQARTVEAAVRAHDETDHRTMAGHRAER